MRVWHWWHSIWQLFWTRWAISRSIVTSVVLLHLMRSGQVCPAASRRGVVGQVGKNHALFIIILAEDLVVTKEKAIANAKPVITLLARETFQVVDVGLCSHHHFESWDHFVTCTAIPSGSKEPEIVSFAEQKISFGVKRRSHFS